MKKVNIFKCFYKNVGIKIYKLKNKIRKIYVKNLFKKKFLF